MVGRIVLAVNGTPFAAFFDAGCAVNFAKNGARRGIQERPAS
jgi:hypothetical protein